MKSGYCLAPTKNNPTYLPAFWKTEKWRRMKKKPNPHPALSLPWEGRERETRGENL